MRYLQLKAFHAVAIHGSFSAAANSMGLTQPVLSDHVRALETRYDIRLFDRRRKPLALTAEGEKLLTITHPLMEQEQQALEYLSSKRNTAFGRLRLMADAVSHVSGLIGAFRQRYPDIVLELKVGNSHMVLDSILNWQADIGVIGEVPGLTQISSFSLGASPIMALSSHGNQLDGKPSVSLETLAKLPLILREQGSRTRAKVEKAAAAIGIRLEPAIVSQSREAVRDIVAAGGGIGFVSAAEHIPDDRLYTLPIDCAANTRAAQLLQMEESLICLVQRREVGPIRAFMAMAEQRPKL